MFYEIFLGNNDVRQQLEPYHALALVEWTSAVAGKDTLLEHLYLEAKLGKDETDLWVKEMRTANSSLRIYNNHDPGFVEYVTQGRARWGFHQPYDEAMSQSLRYFHNDKLSSLYIVRYLGYVGVFWRA